MILESHWRVIKHDYLHRFNRPRVDLVLWVLDTYAVPRLMKKMVNIISGDIRLARSSWRKTFKRDWKKLQNAEIGDGKLEKYHTDPTRWTCGCLSFLNHRFLLCKHLISCYEPVADAKFFWTVKRQRTSPFWLHELLVLRPEFRRSSLTLEGNHGEENITDIEDEVLNDAVQEENDFAAEDLETDDERRQDTSVSRRDKFKRTLRGLLETYEDQESKGNDRFCDTIVDGFDPIVQDGRRLLEDVDQLKSRRTMPLTWDGRHKHPATIFYQ